MKTPANPEDESAPSLNDLRATELRRIAAANGGVLNPEHVVEAARSKTSVLHSAFTWDDSEAAQQYRLWQARQLIRVTVIHAPLKGEPQPIRVFVSLSPDRKEGGYRETAAVLSDRDFRAQLLQDARDDLRRLELKYAQLTELSEVFKASRKFRELFE